MPIDQLFDLSKTITASFIKNYAYPWQALPFIKDLIPQLIAQLPKDYREVKENVWIGPGTWIESTALIQGPAIFGANCQIRHAAFVRDHVITGDEVVIGNSTEVKNVILFDGVQLPHFNYVGDSILGYKAHLGAGAILSNFKSTADEVNVIIDGQKTGSGLRKFGALLGDRVEIGSNSVLYPGTIVGRDCIIYPLTPVRGTIPAQTIIKGDGKHYRRDLRG